MELLPEHPDDVLGQVLSRAVGAVGDALHPHRAGQEIGAGQRHLRRPVGERAHERSFVDREGPRAAERAEHGRMAYLGGRHVERLHLGLELRRIVHQRQEIGQRDEPAVVEAAAHEAGVVVAPLLAVGHRVDPGAELGLHAEPDRVVGGGFELAVAEPAFQVVVHGLAQPAWPRPAPDARHREGRQGRSRCGRRKTSGDLDRHRLEPENARGSLAAGARAALGQRALAHQEAALPPATHQRDQLVAGHAAPRGEVRLDRDLGGAELEELPALQRIDVLPDQEQETVAAVEVAPVEADVGLVGMALHRIHGNGPRRASSSRRGCRRTGTRPAWPRPRWRRRPRGCSRRACAS